MADVFVSHVEEDREIAMRIASYLEDTGFSTWYYERDSLPGVSYLLQTAQAIEASKAIVLIISSHSLGSHQVTKEVVRGHESNKHFVPVLVDVSHVEFQNRQPEWREAVGAATSIRLLERGVQASMRAIEKGLWQLGVIPQTSKGLDSGEKLKVDHGPSETGERLVKANSEVDRAIPTVQTGTSVGEVRRFKGHTSYVYDVAFLPDGGRFLSSGQDDTVRLWDLTKGRTIRRFEPADGAFSVDVSTDGRHALSCGYQCVQIWDVASGTQILRIPTQGRGARFSPDGRQVASGAGRGIVGLWSIESGQKESEFEGYVEPVESVAFSPDGQRIVAAARERSVRVWDISDPHHIVLLQGHTDSVYCVAFSPNGHHVASGGADASLRLWDAASGKMLHCFEGHEWTVTDLAFSPSGGLLVSASVDKTVRVWTVESGAEVCCFKHKANVTSVAISSDGRFALSGCEDYAIHLWRLPS